MSSTAHHPQFTRFLQEPGGHVLLDLSLNVVEIGDTFARMSYLRPDEAVGKYLFDLFPSPQIDGQSKTATAVQESIDRVKRTLQPDKIPPVHVRLHRPASMGNGWEERWWAVASIPLLGDDGKLQYIVQRVEDYTAQVVALRAVTRQTIKNYALYFMCVVLVGLVSYAFARTTSQVSRVNKTTCEVQARNLPAQHRLSRVMQDFDTLIRISPTPLTGYRAQVVKDLDQNLEVYVRVTESQPQSRKC